MEKLLISEGRYTYKNVSRWSKKFNVFDADKLFFPVNLSNAHWAMVVVNMQRQEIHYYDSLRCDGTKYLTGMLRWLKDEATTKNGGRGFDENKWKTFHREMHVPQQGNGNAYFNSNNKHNQNQSQINTDIITIF